MKGSARSWNSKELLAEGKKRLARCPLIIVMRFGVCPRVAYAAAVLIAAIGCKPVADNQSAQLNRELTELRSAVTSQASLISGLQAQISWMQAQIDLRLQPAD